ncbi:MAG: tRNA (adenosine(37)-N6)-threonylcarbamoyltransferase complex ATPase subunit type 1 TsaE [Clostridiales bacterium]|nr:tRNA (adenosine(37)-N6)-threonylcarbamoyltransferase complex ATPase subunit type 1 TsaE [Clostridiales bacterium]
MNELFSVITKNEKETMAVGASLAKTVGKGVVFTLVGDLGAGKTHFVKGFVKGLDCDELVTSPTFTLLNVYEGGKFPVYHFDMYRLNSLEEAEELGFNEYFDLDSLDGVVLVEWPSQVEGLIKCSHIEIKIEKLQEEQRKITLSSIVGEDQ